MALTSNYTESTRSLTKGFVLNEQEFRRTVEVINEQFDKKGAPNPTIKYTVKHQNGLVAETFNLEDIFKIENAGSQQIVSLTVNSVSTTQPDDNINVTFSNKYSEKVDDEYPIKYKVRGIERDWVMISSSLIEDRLNKITSTDYFSSFSRRFFLGIITTIMFGSMIIAVNSIEDSSHYQDTTKKVLSELENKYKKGNVDIIKAMIDIERSKLYRDNSGRFPSKLIIYTTIPLMLLFLISDFIKKKLF